MSRLAMVGLLLAVKSQEDTYYNNTYYARIGGVTVNEINSLEQEFIIQIDYGLFIP
jgi:hypothetical protein